MVDGVHVLDELQDLVGITPLVVERKFTLLEDKSKENQRFFDCISLFFIS